MNTLAEAACRPSCGVEAENKLGLFPLRGYTCGDDRPGADSLRFGLSHREIDCPIRLALPSSAASFEGVPLLCASHPPKDTVSKVGKIGPKASPDQGGSFRASGGFIAERKPDNAGEGRRLRKICRLHSSAAAVCNCIHLQGKTGRAVNATSDEIRFACGSWVSFALFQVVFPSKYARPTLS
jgi:hypothetical protein